VFNLVSKRGLLLGIKTRKGHTSLPIRNLRKVLYLETKEKNVLIVLVKIIITGKVVFTQSTLE
jgi:hypothetical protein